MKPIMQFLLPSIYCLSLVSCSPPTTTNQVALSTSLAYCQISSGAASIVCVDYAANTPANNTDCTGNEMTTYAGRGASQNSYQVGTNGATVSCSQQQGGLILVGHCLLGSETVNYYTTVWSLSTAQADCTARAGTWAPP